MTKIHISEGVDTGKGIEVTVTRSLQLEVSKYYRNRDGKKVGPLQSMNDPNYPNYKFKDDKKVTYTNNGMYWDDGDESNFDLIEEWKDEKENGPFEIISKKSDTANILAERQKTHGDFTDNARVMQKLKEAVMCEDGWQKLSLVQREALQMILHKCGRIISGNPNEPDHWLDIAGYATLAKDRVES